MPRGGKSESRKTSEPELKEGMRVEYHPVGGAHGTATSIGIIKRVISHEETVGSSPHHVKADEEHPRYLIVNEHTKKETPYKRDNIVRVLEEEEEEED